MSPNNNMNILFVGDFQHKNLESDIDEITFREAVIVKGFQIVPSGTNPHPDTLPNFQSVTQKEKFTLELFARDLNNPQKTHFDRLTPKFEAQGGVTFNTQEEIITNHLILRGVYSALSICLYGSVVPRPQLSQHILGALEKGPSADSAPEPVNSSASWEIEKCPLPPNSSLADPWELTFTWTQAPGLGEVPSNLLWAEEKVDPYSAGFYMNTEGIRQLSSVAYYLAEKPLSAMKPSDQYDMVLNAATSLKQAMQVTAGATGDGEPPPQLAPCTDCLPSWLGEAVVTLALDGCKVLTEGKATAKASSSGGSSRASEAVLHDQMRVAQAALHLVQVVLVNGILAYSFAQSGGLEQLYLVLEEDLTPPKAKLGLLKALWNGAQHTTVLAHFLATHQVAGQERTVCGYAVTLALATSSRPKPKAMMDLCRALLRRAALFHALDQAAQHAFRMATQRGHLLQSAVPNEWPEVVAAVFNRHPVQSQQNQYRTDPKEDSQQFSQLAQAYKELHDTLKVEMEEEGKTATSSYMSAYPEGHLGRMVQVPPLCSAPLRRLLAENGFLELLAVGTVLALHAGDTQEILYPALAQVTMLVVGTKGGDLLLSSQPRIVTAMARILDGTPSLGNPEGVPSSALSQASACVTAPALARLISQTVCVLGLVEGLYASVAALQAYKTTSDQPPQNPTDPSPQRMLLDALLRALHGVAAGLSVSASGRAAAVRVVAAHALPSLFELLKDDSSSLPAPSENQDPAVSETVQFVHQNALRLLLDTIDSDSQAANAAIITNWEDIKKAIDWAILDSKRTGDSLSQRARSAVNFMDPLCQTLPDGVLGLINLLQEMSKDLSVIGNKDELDEDDKKDTVVKKEEDSSKDDESKKPMTVRFLPALTLVLRAICTISSDEVAHHQICSSETVPTLINIVNRCSKIFYPDLRYAADTEDNMLEEVTKGTWPCYTKSPLTKSLLNHYAEVLKCLTPCLRLLKVVLQKMATSGVRNFWDDLLFDSLVDTRCSLSFLPGVQIINESMKMENLGFGLSEFGQYANETQEQIAGIIQLWLPPSTWARPNAVLNKMCEKILTSPFYITGGLGLLMDLVPSSPPREPTEDGPSVARQWSVMLGQSILKEFEVHSATDDDSNISVQSHWFSKFPKPNIIEVVSKTLPWTLVTLSQTSSPELHNAALKLVQRVISLGAHAASAMVLVTLFALYRSLQTIIKKNYSKKAKRVLQGDAKQATVWEATERILLMIRDIGVTELGRKALLKHKAIEGLVGCLGLGRTEVTVAALQGLGHLSEGVDLMGSHMPVRGRMVLGAVGQAGLLAKAAVTVVRIHHAKPEVVVAGARLLCQLLHSQGSAATTMAVETPVRNALTKQLHPKAKEKLKTKEGQGEEKTIEEEGEQLPVWILPELVISVTSNLEKAGQQVAGYLEEFPLQHGTTALQAARAAAWALQLVLMASSLGSPDHLHSLMESLKGPVLSLAAGASALRETCESVSEDLCRNLAEVDITKPSSCQEMFKSELPFSLLLSQLKKLLSMVVSMCDQLLNNTNKASLGLLNASPFFQISRQFIEPLMTLDTRYEAEKMSKYTTAVLRLEQIEEKTQEKKKQKTLANKRTKLERPPPPLPLMGIDRFRSRKSTSSRGPSKHVDDFMKDDSMAPLAGAVPAVVAQKDKK